MINILSYIGMSIQSEVCLWTLIGIVRTIFDATLFKVNANLKQVWQMAMPDEISLPVQRVLRTMISGVMLVQCFTVYVYLASYIVLLYPVFLEERPTLVLPWLLLAAVRQLLCELTSLALGLGTCVLVGPARSPCIKFVIIKLISIMPAFYMWTLVFSYYNILKMATTFKTFPVGLEPSDHDYGLELAIRRRRTKSLFCEDQLRSKLVARLYGERPTEDAQTLPKFDNIPLSMTHSTNTSTEDMKEHVEDLPTISFVPNIISDTGSYEDWYGYDFAIPRDADRVLEQLSIMMLRIGVFLSNEEAVPSIEINNITAHSTLPIRDNTNCNSLQPDDTDTPPQVGSRGNIASYVREYPNIFMKKSADVPRSPEILKSMSGTIRNVQNQEENETSGNIIKTREKKRTVSISPKERISVEIEKVVSRRKSSVDKEIQHSKERIPHTSGISIDSKDNLNVQNDSKKVLPEVKKTKDSNAQTSDSRDDLISKSKPNVTNNKSNQIQNLSETNRVKEEQSSTSVKKQIDDKDTDEKK